MRTIRLPHPRGAPAVQRALLERRCHRGDAARLRTCMRGRRRPLRANARLLAGGARNDDAAGVERALHDGAAVNSRNRLGETALLMRAQEEPRRPGATRARRRRRRQRRGDQRHHAADGGRVRRQCRPDARRCWRAAPTSTPADRIGKTAMTYAAGEGHTDDRRACCSTRASTRTPSMRNDLTALMWAAGYGQDRDGRAC